MTDISSAEETSQKRIQNKEQQTKNIATLQSVESHRESLTDLNQFAYNLKLDDIKSVKLKTLQELMEEHIHLNEESNCKIIQEKRINIQQTSLELNTNHQRRHPRLLNNNKNEWNTQLSEEEQQNIQKSHNEQSNQDPYQLTAFLQRRKAISIPKFYCPDDHKHSLSQIEIERQLKENKLQLCCLDADFESSLLAQASIEKLKDHNGILRQFPLCRNRSNCVGSTIKIPYLTEKIILTALMFPHEYEEFLNNGTTPRIDRPCILCCRFILVDFDITCRELLMLGSSGHLKQSNEKSWHMESMQIMQIYYNKLDCEGGYYSQFCLTPRPREPLLQPIVRLNRLRLRAHKVNNRWYIDQSALVWKPPIIPTPIMGESVKNF